MDLGRIVGYTVAAAGVGYIGWKLYDSWSNGSPRTVSTSNQKPSAKTDHKVTPEGKVKDEVEELQTTLDAILGERDDALARANRLLEEKKQVERRLKTTEQVYSRHNKRCIKLISDLEQHVTTEKGAAILEQLRSIHRVEQTA